PGPCGHTPLAVAAGKGRLEAMKLLMAKGAPADSRAAGMGPTGETPLFRAAREGQVEAMKLLIERGAKVNAKGSDNRTPLFELATLTSLRPNEKEAMLLLLASQADPDAKDSSGQSVLAFAVDNKNAAAIAIMKEHGA